MNLLDYNKAKSWKERKEILKVFAEQGKWELLKEVLPPERLSDYYLKEKDDYYTSKNPHKVTVTERPYLTLYQEETRGKKEFDFTDLSMKQLKAIEQKNVDIDKFLD